MARSPAAEHDAARSSQRPCRRAAEERDELAPPHVGPSPSRVGLLHVQPAIEWPASLMGGLNCSESRPPERLSDGWPESRNGVITLGLPLPVAALAIGRDGSGSGLDGRAWPDATRRVDAIKGMAPAMNDLISGKIAVGFINSHEGVRRRGGRQDQRHSSRARAAAAGVHGAARAGRAGARASRSACRSGGGA